MRLYVNGVLVGTRAQTGAIATTTDPLRIGGDTRWGEYFNGLIDEVRVYNRALTVTEIQADMAAPVSQVDFTPPTVSWFSPAAGSTNVSLSTSVVAVFDEVMAASSISSGTFELRNDTNRLVAASVTYDPATFTAILHPASNLSQGGHLHGGGAWRRWGAVRARCRG